MSAGKDHLVEVDGLRGIAIALVLCFHLQLPGVFKFGWAGVQLFFAISGFLITRILISARERPRYFRNFYVRRTLRIFPIYYLYVIAVTAGAVLVLGKREHLASLPWYLTYLQTIPLVSSRFTEGLPVASHTWSLAIEEQFYWVWPFVVLWLRGGALRVAIAVLFFAALAGRFVAAQLSDNPYLLNATLFSELDAIAVGAFLAAWLDAKPDLAVVRKVAWAALGVGGLAVVGIIGFPGGHWAVVQLTAFAVFFGGALWLAVLAPPIRALRFGPLVRLGKISYGVYLYHPLIFFLVEKGLKGRLEQPVAVVAIKLLLLWAVAEASWKLIESPLLALKDRFAPSG